MLSLVMVEWLFAILVLIVFTNRYIFGSLARMADRRVKPDYDRDPPQWPRVAIIVPVYNEGASVQNTAASFDALDYPRDKLSVIFVDDCSTDGTYEHLLTARKLFSWMQVE